MRFLVLIAICLIGPAANAQGKKVGVAESHGAQHDAARRGPVLAYVEANIAETLYHELGHAVIQVLDLPIYGPEEYAADMFSVVMMNRIHTEEELHRMAPLIAANYMWYADQVGDSVADLDLWDLHGPDLQRYYTFACLIYGASPETRRDIVTLAALPEERVETCEAEYAQTARAWGDVLDALATDRPTDTLRMDWVVEKDGHLARYVTRIVSRINATMELPETINVSVIPCGQSNAYFDPDYTEIQICTELGDELSNRARALRP